MTSTKFVWAVLAAALVTLGLSLFSLSFRYRVEAGNRAVELVAEMDVVEALGASQGTSLLDGLERLKARGLGAVTLSEQTVGELIDNGDLSMLASTTANTVTFRGSAEVLARVKRGLEVRLGIPASVLESETQPNRDLVVPGFSPAVLRTVSAGLDPFWCALARNAGLRIYARAGNPLGASPNTVSGTLAWLHELGAEVFVPLGDQVLGRRDLGDTFVAGLHTAGLLYASPEFVKLGGDAKTILEIPEKVVRLHSAQALELDRMTQGEAVERYVRAGRERNIRSLLLRPLSYASDRPLESFGNFVGAVTNGMVKEKGGVGPAKPFEEPQTPRWLFPGIGLGAAVVAFYAASMLFKRPLVLALIGLGSLMAGLGAWLPELRSYSALMAALAFPIAAFGLLEAQRHRNVLLHLMALTFFSLIGGLAVSGLLNSLPYFIRAETFEGVKAAHFLPVLVAGFYMAMRLIDWREGLKSPVTWLQAVLSIVILIGLAVMFARTGNDNPGAVSGAELKLRSLLENLLPVRPRTKEFLFGYPALVVGLGLLMRVRSGGAESKHLAGWAVMALMVGTIAPTSVVNTLCHLHTPLEVGLIRIAVGFVLGGIIGAAVWLAVRTGLPKPRSTI